MTWARCNPHFLFLLTLIFLCGPFLGGCASNHFKATTTVEEFQREYQEAKAKEDKDLQRNYFSAATFCSPEALDYRLGPGDLIGISVFEDKDMTSEARVSSRGTVTLPMLGAVDVLNLTALEAEKKIEGLLREKYFQDPHVTVYIKEHLSRQITVVGAVKSPGSYECMSKKHLLNVLAMAGGLVPEAGEVCYITRENPKTGELENYMIDLDDLVHHGNMEQNIVILGGDEIFVPEAGHCYVDGAVRKPGIYPVKNNLTVTEAIALAGGLTSYAEEDEIKLVRYVRKGKREIIRLRYSELQEGAGDTIYLKGNDIVFVELSAIGTLFSGTGVKLGFMGTGINYKSPVK